MVRFSGIFLRAAVDHEECARQTIVTRQGFLGSFRDEQFRAILGLLLQLAEIALKEECVEPELKRLRINFAVIASRVVEAGDPAGPHSLGVRYWRARLTGPVVDRADRERFQMLAAFPSEEIRILRQDDDLRDAAIALLATPRATAVLRLIGLADYAERVDWLRAHRVYVVDMGGVTVDGLSDLLGERVYVRELGGEGDRRLRETFDDPARLEAGDCAVFGAYESAPAGRQAMLRTAVHELVHNITRVRAPAGAAAPVVQQSGNLDGANFATRDGDETGESWTEAGFAFERRFFGLVVGGDQLCPFSMVNRVKLPVIWLR